MMASYAIVDAIVEALSKAVPDQRVARSGMLLGYALAGIGGHLLDSQFVRLRRDGGPGGS